ncbi:hydrogenase 4 membrane subunit [Fervidicoccus fontis]|nr:hydrogenase 4 membrane subunit [Fervidicoccus fontis]MBE9390654.1 hydrogenase 4 membrane subunit [Fervidicoccus fontis]
MTSNIAIIINGLSALMIFTAIWISETIDLRRAANIYRLQSFLLTLIFAMMSIRDSYFLIWALVAFVTKTLIVPWLVIKSLEKSGERKDIKTSIPSWLTMVIYAILLVFSFWTGGQFKGMIGEDYIPLSVSISLFLIGLKQMVTKKSIFKQILGLCHFENGSHLTLALLAPGIPETIEIGCTTDAVFLIAVCCILAVHIKKVNNTVDVTQLKNLRW